SSGSPRQSCRPWWRSPGETPVAAFGAAAFEKELHGDHAQPECDGEQAKGQRQRVHGALSLVFQAFSGCRLSQRRASSHSAS
ncbi:hypothetical protein, partial [Salmonella sp. SAL4458]|uniref:hypothetical protein n=1 Tax=Salmonella sp. SAL4458 TaxID=3159913 RepID=UPI0039790D25